MGLETTAVHAVWFFAILTVAGVALPAFFDTSEALVEAGELREAAFRERLHGRVGDGWFCHDEDSQMLLVHVENAGRTTFSLEEVTVLVDGVVLAGFSAEPDVTGSDLWAPGEEADFQRGGVASEPARVALVTERGVVAFPEKVENCPILTTITLTPASASMQIGDAQTFDAAGFDQFGEPFEVPTFTWSAGGAGTLTQLNATAARLVAGTTSGTYTLTAAYGAVTGSATVTIHPGAPVTLTLAPDPVDVAAGGTQAFVASPRDAYGNVNATTPVTWTTNAGSITSGGVLTAQTTAQAGRVVTAAAGALSDTSTVNVIPGPVARVTVTPATLTLNTQATQAFSAAAYDAYDNPVTNATFTWSATRGAVTSAGAYTAPATTGADTVTATAGGVGGTASVNVVRTVHVESVQTFRSNVATTAFFKKDTLEVRVTVRDHLGNLAQGVTATVQLIEPDTDLHTTLSGATSSSGVASGTYYLAPSVPQGAAWYARVSNLSGTGFVYDAAANTATQVQFSVAP